MSDSCHYLKGQSLDPGLQDEEEALPLAHLAHVAFFEQATVSPASLSALLRLVLAFASAQGASHEQEGESPAHSRHHRLLLDLLSHAVHAFDARYNGLVALWSHAEAAALLLPLLHALTSVLAPPEAAAAGAQTVPILRARVIELAHAAVEGAPLALADCLADQALSARLRGALDSARGAGSPDREGLTHLWLSVTLALPQGPEKLEWARVLLERHTPALLESSWRDEEMTSLIQFLAGVQADGDAPLPVRGLLAGLLRSMLTAAIEVSADCGTRCLTCLLERIRAPGTRRLVMQQLKRLHRELVGLMRRSFGSVASAAAALYGELMGLTEADRQHMEQTYALRRADAAPTSLPTQAPVVAPPEDEPAQGEGLFSHDVDGPGGATAGAAGTMAAAVEAEDLAKAREVLLAEMSPEPGRPSPARCSDVPNRCDQGAGLVLTPTTEENLGKVMELSQGGMPVLLEGATGVGKTAVVMEAGRRQGRVVVRVNMSRSVTIDEIFGQVAIAAQVCVPSCLPVSCRSWESVNHIIALSRQVDSEIMACLVGPDVGSCRLPRVPWWCCASSPSPWRSRRATGRSWTRSTWRPPRCFRPWRGRSTRARSSCTTQLRPISRYTQDPICALPKSHDRCVPDR
jgi:hypothetical protein